MSQSPAFQFYPGDYLGSQRVQLMTLEQEGAYIRLLCYCWQHGSIPNDAEQLARLIGKGASTTLATVVQTMFQPHPTNGSALVHERLEFERAKQTAWREKSVEGGKKSAAMRSKAARKRGSRVVQPPLQNGSNQKATLQSSVSVLQSSSTDPDLPKPAASCEVEKTVEQLRAEKLFHRRPTTPWDRNCKTAWDRSKLAVVATTEDEWQLLEWFYSIPGDGTYRRHDLPQLLNNWTAEIDRARNFKANGKSNDHRPTNSRSVEHSQDYSGITDH